LKVEEVFLFEHSLKDQLIKSPEVTREKSILTFNLVTSGLYRFNNPGQNELRIPNDFSSVNLILPDFPSSRLADFPSSRLADFRTFS